MTVEHAKPEDLKEIAQCHRRCFPESFATKLGLAYLMKMYEWYLSNPFTFLLVLWVDKKVTGFAGGLLKDEKVRTGSASGMAQYSFSAACKAIIIRPWLIFHPELMTRYKFIIKNIRMKFGGRPQNQDTAPRKKQAGLVIIAVDPDHQGKGYGSVLLQKFEQVSLQRGFMNLQLSVRAKNVQAIKTYERNGWVMKESNGKDRVMEKSMQR